MKEIQFQKVIDLARKTGDKLIVFDGSGDGEAYVIMPLGAYEKMAVPVDASNVKNLTEEEMLDKINRDIAIWKNRQFLSAEEDLDNLSAERGKNSFSNIKEILEKRGEGEKKNAWKIPPERKERAEELVEDENRQYLEDVPY